MSRKSGLIAIALVLAVFAFEFYFLRPEVELMKDRIDTAYSMMQKEEQYLKASVASGEGINTVAREVEVLEKRLIPGKSEFLAAAGLQGEVSDLAGKAGLKVMTIRPAASSRAGDYRNIPIYVEGSGTTKEIGDFLKYIETDALLIKIDKLGLNITNMQNPKELKFKIQVSGLAKL